MPKIHDIDCELNYQVQTSCTFVLKIEAAFIDGQDIRAESLYEIGTSKPYGTTRDVLDTRTGVCRDYAPWALFDPTQMAQPGDVIRIGTGHDAADLPFAAIFGNAVMTRMSPLVTTALAGCSVAA